MLGARAGITRYRFPMLRVYMLHRPVEVNFPLEDPDAAVLRDTFTGSWMDEHLYVWGPQNTRS